MAVSTAQFANSSSATQGTEHSAGAAFEHLIEGAQGVLSKRIDLALLEGREIASETLDRAVWGAAGIVMATATWLSLAMSLTYLLLPSATPAIRLAAFALINGVPAIATLAYASRAKRVTSGRTRTPMVEAGSAPKSGRDAYSLGENR